MIRLRGVIDPGEDPLWWLEGSSYPIRVVDPGVEVLIASTELGSKYGESPVAVLFKHGQGEVFHMISHYDLQRTELREARHARSASEYATSKGVAADAAMADLNVAEVESAASSSRLFANVVAQKKRAAAERSKRKGGGADA